MIYATPFYDMSEGLPIDIQCEKKTLYLGILDFGVTGDRNQDARRYVEALRFAIDMALTEKQQNKTRRDEIKLTRAKE